VTSKFQRREADLLVAQLLLFGSRLGHDADVDTGVVFDQPMQNLKFGVVACGLVGLIGCFLPLVAGVSFYDTRHFDAPHFYMTAGGYGAALAMGVLAISKGMQRWMSVIAIIAFSLVILRMRGELVELLNAGLGGKLMSVAALAGLALAILTTVKPEPVK
jgi:peptidoglycan/LPS O-acetylase OafA/YrhL